LTRFEASHIRRRLLVFEAARELAPMRTATLLIKLRESWLIKEGDGKMIKAVLGGVLHEGR
jgi:hypothetical protein